MSVERRGQVIRALITLVNWQQEEPIDRGEGRQLFMDDTSRVSREAQARFSEGLGVKLPGATRPAVWIDQNRLNFWWSADCVIEVANYSRTSVWLKSL